MLSSSLILGAMAIAATPIGLGPEDLDRAIRVEAPIAEVTVFGDRARVRRRVRADLSAEGSTLRFPDIPGGSLLDTIRVQGRGAKIHRVEVSPVEVERVSLEAVSKLLDAIEAERDACDALAAEQQLWQAQLEQLLRAQPAPPVSEEKRDGRAAPPLSPEVWARGLNWLDAERGRTRKKLLELGRAREQKERKLEALTRELARHDLGALSERRYRVSALVEAIGRGAVELELEYFVLGASWRPRHRATYLPQRGEISLTTAAMVQQSTGESWDDVELFLSTATPNADQTLPRLSTWTLGEKKELTLIPQPRVPQVPEPRGFESPASGRLRPSEIEAILAREELSDRLSGLEGGLGGSEPVALSAYVEDEARSEASPPARAKSWSPAMMRDSMAAASEPMAAAKLAPEGASLMQGAPPLSLALFEPPSPRRPESTDPELPAALAGGFDYVYKAPTLARIASGPEAQAIPLTAETHPAATLYEVVPGVDRTAYLLATVTHRGARPILGGPLAIFSGGNFVADGRLQTTGPGGTLELPLGADEDVRVLRKVITKTETSGVFSKKETTGYEVRIEVANYKGRTIKVRVHEPLPRSNQEEVEIERVRTVPSAVPDAEGLVRWEVEVPPKEPKVLILEYRIRRPASWQLRQQ